MDSALKTRLHNDPELVARFDILVSIPGIGALIAINILRKMPELGHLDSKQVAGLAGLTPQASNSGQHRGRGHIRSGHAILCPSTLHASHRRHPLRRRYEQ
ncbi:MULTISPECIES: transposase [Sphingobium]|uniref:transposase n=1 Tax=Sphingobium TaxID=165695 RepID=UPI00159C62BF|nr:transposase [Sphingobium sp. 15-1]